MGYNAAGSTTGADNTAIGNVALQLSTSGSNSTAVGSAAMGGGIVTGTNNTSVGSTSAYFFDNNHRNI